VSTFYKHGASGFSSDTIVAMSSLQHGVSGFSSQTIVINNAKGNGKS